MEIWKTIKDFPDYAVSDFGMIKRIMNNKNNRFKAGTILKPQKKKHGYLEVNLFNGGKQFSKLIHRLVLETFNYKCGYEVNHKNGIKTDNRLENLEWCTRSENEKHAYKIGLKNPDYNSKNVGENHPQSILTEKDVIKIKEHLKYNILNQKEIGDKFGVKSYVISKIKLGKTWKHIEI